MTDTETLTIRPVPVYDPRTPPDLYTLLEQRLSKLGETVLHSTVRPNINYHEMMGNDLDRSIESGDFEYLEANWNWFLDTRDLVLKVESNLHTDTARVRNAALDELLSIWKSHVAEYVLNRANQSLWEADHLTIYSGIRRSTGGLLLTHLAFFLWCGSINNPFSMDELRSSDHFNTIFELDDPEEMTVALAALTELVEKGWLSEVEPGRSWAITTPDIRTAIRTHRV